MKTENGIPILDSGKEIFSKEEKCSKIAIAALKKMTDELVKMENLGANHKTMMEKCVWPIIYDAGKKFEEIDNEV